MLLKGIKTLTLGPFAKIASIRAQNKQQNNFTTTKNSRILLENLLAILSDIGTILAFGTPRVPTYKLNMQRTLSIYYNFSKITAIGNNFVRFSIFATFTKQGERARFSVLDD